jgi:hypothetical protein
MALNRSFIKMAYYLVAKSFCRKIRAKAVLCQRAIRQIFLLTLAFLRKKKGSIMDKVLSARVDVDRASRLYRQWHPSHGIDANDALLAAAAMQSGGRIYCLNAKHYPMPEVLVKRAW